MFVAATAGAFPSLILARADEALPAAPAAASSISPGATAQNGAPPWAGDLETRSELLGDIGGLRPALDRRGISFGLAETTEVLGNPSGGLRRGAILEGVTQVGLGVDLGKAVGLQGGLFNVTAFQIHGSGLTPNIGALDAVSSIEADPTTRLNELWYQQSFADGRVDVKVGQQSADLEFITSEYEDLFINSGFGWPTLPALDLPSGGPAYPLSTPGLRVRVKPSDEVTALVGLFNGSPAGLRPGDPQRIDGAGTRFDVSSGAFLIGEVQVATNGGTDARGLPGTYKFGGWYNSNRFANAFYNNGTTAQPPGVLVGIPRSYRGDWSIYGTVDQLVYRPQGKEDGGLAVTARAMGAPSDRNLVDLFLQGGVTYKGVFGRDNDTVGFGVEWARVGAQAREGDAAAVLVAGTTGPVRGSETVLEATYQAQVAPWWQVQPDLQLVFNPGGGFADPDGPGRRVGTATVLGVRSILTF